MEVSGPEIDSEPQLRLMRLMPQLRQHLILSPTALGRELNLHLPSDLSHCSQILNPLYHSGNSYYLIFKNFNCLCPQHTKFPGPRFEPKLQQ